jgi:peroxiredoxin
VSSSVYELPEGLPVPEDDGACDHLLGRMLPQLTLQSSQGPVSLRQLSLDRLVLYIYPRTGKPGEPTPPEWDAIPGARGCTPESCAFRDHAGELSELGAKVAGLSAQPLEEQLEFAERNGIPYPVISDPDLKLAAALSLPTFEFGERTLYKRVTLVVEACAIAKVFYPVFPPNENAADVAAWLKGR